MRLGLPYLGSQFRYKVTDFSLTTGNFTQVAKLDGNRYFILFSNNTGVAAFVSPDGPFPGLTGIPVTQTTLPLRFDWDEAGGLVQAPWWATCNPASTTLEVIEVWYQPTGEVAPPSEL